MVAGLCVVVAAANADETAASYGATDPAQVACPLMMRMDERAPRGTEQQLYTWLLGYVAGRVAADPDGALQPLPSSGELRERYYGELLRYCREHPQATFGMAVDQLLGEITASTTR
jgi:hypothetical protein